MKEYRLSWFNDFNHMLKRTINTPMDKSDLIYVDEIKKRVEEDLK